MTDTKKPDLRVIHTEPFRMGFPTLPPQKPKVDDQTGRETFGILMMFPPGLKTDRYVVALEHAMIEKFGPDAKRWPRYKRKADDVIEDFGKWNEHDAKTPLLPLDAWHGWTKINTSTTSMYPPNVVGMVKGPDGRFPHITDPREIYGGRWARATIEAYYYPNNGGGVTFGLKSVQLLKHDTRFGMAPRRPEDDFADDVPEQYRDDGDAFEQGNQAQAQAGNGW